MNVPIIYASQAPQFVFNSLLLSVYSTGEAAFRKGVPYLEMVVDRRLTILLPKLRSPSTETKRLRIDIKYFTEGQ